MKKEEAVPASGFSDTRILRQRLTELEQIEQRKQNLIVANLAEQNTPAEDIQLDTTMIKEEFNLIKIEMATRIGSARERKDRPLKIELDSVGDRNIMLSKAKEL